METCFWGSTPPGMAIPWWWLELVGRCKSELVLASQSWFPGSGRAGSRRQSCKWGRCREGTGAVGGRARCSGRKSQVLLKSQVLEVQTAEKMVHSKVLILNPGHWGWGLMKWTPGKMLVLNQSEVTNVAAVAANEITLSRL